MDDLLKAFQIFRKYTNDDVLNCDHDVMFVCIDPEIVTDEDKIELKKLGFDTNWDGNFYSYRFGSC